MFARPYLDKFNCIGKKSALNCHSNLVLKTCQCLTSLHLVGYRIGQQDVSDSNPSYSNYLSLSPDINK